MPAYSELREIWENENNKKRSQLKKGMSGWHADMISFGYKSFAAVPSAFEIMRLRREKVE